MQCTRIMTSYDTISEMVQEWHIAKAVPLLQHTYIVGRIDGRAKCSDFSRAAGVIRGYTAHASGLAAINKAFGPRRLSRMMVAQDQVGNMEEECDLTVVTLERCQSRINHSPTFPIHLTGNKKVWTLDIGIGARTLLPTW